MYDNLNAEIGRKGLLKKEIAAKLNISPSALRMKLSGEKRFFIDEAFKLSELLGGHSIEYKRLLNILMPGLNTGIKKPVLMIVQREFKRY